MTCYTSKKAAEFAAAGRPEDNDAFRDTATVILMMILVDQVSVPMQRIIGMKTHRVLHPFLKLVMDRVLKAK